MWGAPSPRVYMNVGRLTCHVFIETATSAAPGSAGMRSRSEAFIISNTITHQSPTGLWSSLERMIQDEWVGLNWTAVEAGGGGGTTGVQEEPEG